MSTNYGLAADMAALLNAVLAFLHEEQDWLRSRIQAEMALLRVEMADRRNQQSATAFDLAAVQAELAAIRAELAAPPRAAVAPPQQIEERAA
jgi:hypothetical protein